MQNKINDRNRAREERHKQHIARNEGNYKVIFDLQSKVKTKRNLFFIF